VRAFAAFTFPSTEAGWDGMRAMFQAGLRPTVSRLYDPFDAMLARMGGVNGKKHVKKTGLPPAPGLGSKTLRTVLRRPTALNELIDLAGGRALGGAMLVVIFEGAGDGPAGDLARARTILENAGARYDGQEPARRWLSHRYAVSYRQAPVYASGAWVDTMEVAATWQNLGALYNGVRKALGRHVFVMAHLSHAYPDGCCIYFSFAGSAGPSASRPGTWDEASLAAYELTWRDGLAAAEAAGGTIAHHHGVGRSKAPRISRELGAAVEVVRALKRALDPRGIMNPGNLLPETTSDTTQSSRDVTPSTDRITLDRTSLLVDASGDVTLAELEAWLAKRELTLGVTGANVTDATVAMWIADGAAGARDAWLDPADHLVAGFVARFVDGSDVVVRPAPRRSVGPDLFALVVGGRGRFANLSRAWIRVHELGGARAETAPFKGERSPAVNSGEERMLERIHDALR